VAVDASILVVDDDPGHRIMLKTLLGGWGYRIVDAPDGDKAVEAVEKGPFDLVLMDIRMIQMSGIEALKKIKRRNPAIPVILMTAYSSVETAVEALKEGAYDYLTKPLDFNKLRVTIQLAMEHRSLKEENQLLKEQLELQIDRRKIIGQSRSIEKLLTTVAQVAHSDATVLITGESGTGKELIASALHFSSPRKIGPFIRLNCAAITSSLLESELFGHERGSFTGADRKKEGCFVQADGGSLFLDEVSEMPLVMQAKLLRVLQERELVRVGGEEVIRVDVRVIAATNRNLAKLVEDGGFREDLFYRLNVVVLDMPPLRDRREDIPLLAQHFLKKFAEQNTRSFKGFTPQAIDRMLRYHWPGNIRELMNAVERAVVLGTGEYLGVEDFPVTPAVKDFLEKDDHHVLLEGIPCTPLEEVEKAAILSTLDAVEGNKSEAARRLGITRKTLHKKLKKYGLMT
jgi:two-component system response regulator HydG